MLAKVISAAMLGIDAHPVDVEVDVAPRGLPHFSIVGLPDAAVKESRDRVRAALKNIGLAFPLKPITVNLAPADLRKEGAAFDLPVAVGLLTAEGVIPEGAASPFIFAGELSLDGRLKPIRGALCIADLARRLGKKLIVPLHNVQEASIVESVEAYGVESLPELIGFLRGESLLKPMRADIDSIMTGVTAHEEDFSDVKGQELAKRALEVAAAGGHHVLMMGPPGSGKTMLARRLLTILPPITFDEAIQTTKVHSVAGLLPDGAMITGRPFRSPHHTVSDIALIGGGQVPRPGEVSLAHNGVLFLDELPEFKRNALEVLRQPIEAGEVTVSRAAAAITYPANFTLVAAMNPCPCGYHSDPRRDCVCTPGQIQRYRSRVSGPLMDRFDIHIEVPAVPYKDISADHSGEASPAIKARVSKARALQGERLGALGHGANAHMKPRHIKQFCKPEPAAEKLLETAMARLGLSARAYTRILKLSRTIADLEGAVDIAAAHVSEAIQYRTLDRRL